MQLVWYDGSLSRSIHKLGITPQVLKVLRHTKFPEGYGDAPSGSLEVL